MKNYTLKLLPIVLLISFLFFQCEQEDNIVKSKTDLENLNIFGNVKSVYEELCYADENSKEPKKGSIHTSSLTHFNTQGNITEKSTHYLNGQPTAMIEKFYYDIIGRCYVKQQFAPYRYNFKGKIDSFFYNTEDLLAEVISYYGSYTSDSFNRESRSTYLYNKKGQLIEKNYFYFEDLLRIYKYVYNLKNQLTTITYYDKNNEYESKTTYEYDKHGNITETYYNENDEPIGSMRKKYDDKGNLIYIYNGTGCIHSESNYKYLFDDKNNWFYCVDYRGGDPTFITERKIEYY